MTTATKSTLEQENAELRRLLLDHHNWIAAAMRVLQPLQQGWMSPPTFETAKALLSDPEPVGSGK